MKIIALTGWSESGKDTVADILVANYGFKKYAVAGPLKDLCASLYGFPRELAETQEGKKTILTVGYKTKTVRELLLQTALVDRTRFGDSVYINEILGKISAEKPPSAVISDVRYLHEYNAIQAYAKANDNFFEIWRIVRDGQTESPVKDISEHSLETLKCHQTILNDGKSLDALKEKVSEAIIRKYELSTPQNEDDGCGIM